MILLAYIGTAGTDFRSDKVLAPPFLDSQKPHPSVYHSSCLNQTCPLVWGQNRPLCCTLTLKASLWILWDCRAARIPCNVGCCPTRSSHSWGWSRTCSKLKELNRWNLPWRQFVLKLLVTFTCILFWVPTNPPTPAISDLNANTLGVGFLDAPGSGRK